MKRYHDAITGKFVTKKYAEENPDTTVLIDHNSSDRNLLEKFVSFIQENNLHLNQESINEFMNQ